ncbi:MAG: IS1595 family transposase [Acidobacteria bacterium]|nr:MAG: IS1595 family transposase [Acidobacteriota bacterium]
MENTMSEPITLQEAIIFYANPDNCLRKLVSKRWPDGIVVCPRCGSKGVKFNAKRRTWQCGSHHPRREFSVKVGTIFEDSPLGLDKWLVALWMIVNDKNGISSWEVHRAIHVTQKTAWFMNHRIRLALQNGTFEKMTGEVEVDETFIGGKARNMHKDKRAEKIHDTGGRDKTPVMGLLERNGQVRAVVVDNRKKGVLQTEVRKNVSAGSALYSDALASYEGLDGEFFHEVVDHAVEYVRGRVHTNGLENFWSLVKRALKGTYVSVEPFHLFRYLDEEAFRYNYRRDMNDSDRFNLALSQIVGKRLTYKQLTGKLLDGETCPN